MWFPNGNASEADDLDRAADLTRQLNDAYIADVRRRCVPEQTVNSDGTWPHPDCVECEDPIPKLRLEMGRIRCVACQTRLERGRFQ